MKECEIFPCKFPLRFSSLSYILFPSSSVGRVSDCAEIV